MRALDENTKISFGILIALLGGAGWLTSVFIQTTSNAQEIREVKEDVKQLQEMRSDIGIIKSDLKRVLKKVEGGE